MKKYYIGLLGFGLLTVGLLGYVLIIGLQSRQDVKTEKFATSAASTLNGYITRNQEIPATLSVAGVTDIPSSVKYAKLSDKQYKFCVTYKADKGYGSSDITSVVTGAVASQVYGGLDDNYGTPSTETSLYLSYSHKKGQECHTVEPYLYKSSSLIDDYCRSYNKDSSYYKTYCSNSYDLNTN